MFAAGERRGGGRPTPMPPRQAAQHRQILDNIRFLEFLINRYRDPADPYRYQPPPVIHAPGSSPYSMMDIWRVNAVLEQHMRAGPLPGSPLSGLQAAKAIDPNKLHHVFGQAKHKLGPLVETFGSQEATFGAVESATQAAVRSQGITGIFRTTIQVGGQNVVVRGAVVEDVG